MEKNKLMMIIIIVLLVVLLASVGVVSVFAFRMITANGSEVEENTPKPVVVLPIDKIWTYNLEDKISTNLTPGEDGSNKHVISVGVTIGVNGSNAKDKAYTALIELIPTKDKVIASEALNVIRKKTYEELNTPEGQEILQDEILTRLQEVFDTNLIVTVYLYSMALN